VQGILDISEWARRADCANVAKINLDESPELAGGCAGQLIPASIVMRDGNAVRRLLGVQTREALAMAIAG
jgi:thioredoxin-like negative regulator of GroEL